VSERITALVADDQALVRAGFRKILDAEPDIRVVGEAGDGVDAVELAALANPDVALLDIRMPRLDGIEAARRILARNGTRTRVMMLTTFGIDEYVYASLKAGASGFLLKDAPPEDLIAGVRVIARGDALLAPQVTRSIIERFVDHGAGDPELRARIDELTAREAEVLRLLTRGLSNAELAEELVVSAATAKSHIARVLMKLGVRDRVQAVIAAYESGLVRPGAPR
jgi:DNA-binding NarL/FixJ family response regulator